MAGRYIASNQIGRCLSPKMRHSQKIRERIIRGDTVHLDVPEFTGADNDLHQRQIYIPKDRLCIFKIYENFEIIKSKKKKTLKPI